MATATFCLSDTPACPSCGAVLPVERAGIICCEYCHTAIFVDPERAILSRIVYAAVKPAALPELVSGFLQKKYRRHLEWQLRYFPFWQFKIEGRQYILPALDLTEPLPVGDLTANALNQKQPVMAIGAAEVIKPDNLLPEVMEHHDVHGTAENVVLLQLPYYEVTITFAESSRQLVVDGLTGEVWPQGGNWLPAASNWCEVLIYALAITGTAALLFHFVYWPLACLLGVGVTCLVKFLYEKTRAG